MSERPLADPVFEAMTPRVLRESLHGDVCPACCGAKHSMQVLCPHCMALLPEMVRYRLVDDLTSPRYEPALTLALRALGCSTFHRERPGWMQRAPLLESHLDPDRILTPSLVSVYCPRCCSRKTPGEFLCEDCMTRLRRAWIGAVPSIEDADNQQWAMFVARLTPLGMQADAGQYVRAVLRAFDLTHGRIFYYPNPSRAPEAIYGRSQ